MKHEVKSVDQLESLAGAFFKAHPKPSVVAIYGVMGAGKTTFVRALCKHLGVTTEPASPTYSLVNEYPIAGGGRAFHFDLYRMKSAAEVRDIGFSEYIYSGSWCFIEWPDIAAELLPEGFIALRISLNGEERVFEF
ncbi:MAG: hypothetical protein RL220_1567 [Bacteroidota bacterium]